MRSRVWTSVNARRPAANRAAARYRESGVTLIELCMTLAIMGLAMTALMSTLFGAVANSRRNQSLATIETEVRRYSDKLYATPYLSCANASDYDLAVKAGAGETAAPGVTLTVDDIVFWDGVVGSDPLVQTFETRAQSDCNGRPLNWPDTNLQRVRVTVTVEGMTRSEWVVKRRFQ